MANWQLLDHPAGLSAPVPLSQHVEPSVTEDMEQVSVLVVGCWESFAAQEVTESWVESWTQIHAHSSHSRSASLEKQKTSSRSLHCIQSAFPGRRMTPSNSLWDWALL
mmetsp:Transcript_113035/g.314599  ORF Transcript_113035/g.314599 Transcript_113035/m.314599 type:complete len:108 (-) Transcript_113035:226-549(-)